MEQVEYRVWEAHGATTLAPCPACGAEYRHPGRNDPRGAVSLLEHVWHCFVCDTTGGYDELKGLELTDAQKQAASTKKPLPDAHEMQRFWNYCTAIMPSSDVQAYCEAKLARKGFVVPQALARRLPDFAMEVDSIKGWKRSYKLLFPLYDHTGTLRNVIARSLAKSPKIKSMSLRGYTRQGLCLAYQADAQRVVVCEGEMDWLAWVLFGPQDSTVYGVFSGSFHGLHLLDSHRYAEVLLATDLDAAGNKYAAEAMERLHSSNRVTRWSPATKGVEDACDVLQKGGALEWSGNAY